MISEKLLKPEEAAPLLRTTKRTLLDWARQNRVPSKPFGKKCVMFLESDIVRVMQTGLPTLEPVNNIQTIKFNRVGKRIAQKGAWE